MSNVEDRVWLPEEFQRILDTLRHERADALDSGWRLRLIVMGSEQQKLMEMFEDPSQPLFDQVHRELHVKPWGMADLAEAAAGMGWDQWHSDKRNFVEIGIPRGVSYEVATPDIVPGWDLPDCLASCNFGHAWYEDSRSAVLFVPSIVARPERNIVINSLHPEFQDMQVSLETPVRWDRRLFRPSWSASI